MSAGDCKIPCKLFSSAAVPTVKVTSEINHPMEIAWLTWSSEARSILRRLAQRAPCLTPPTIDRFRRSEYGFSLTSASFSELDSDLQSDLASFAEALHHTRTRDLTLLTGLMDDGIDGATIRIAFSFIRAHLVSKTRDPLTAIHAPLGRTGRKAGDFPLHADLYPPVFLLNIFDRVPADDSGASLFLPIAVLEKIISQIDTIPSGEKRRLRGFWSQPASRDRYTRFYTLLHGRDRWNAELQHAMKNAAIRIRLGRGQGYLLHDRHWLHGRESPAGGVPEDRLHRLAFDSASTRRMRLSGTKIPSSH